MTHETIEAIVTAVADYYEISWTGLFAEQLTKESAEHEARTVMVMLVRHFISPNNHFEYLNIPYRKAIACLLENTPKSYNIIRLRVESQIGKLAA